MLSTSKQGSAAMFIVQPTHHVQLRQAQRNISDQDVAFVLCFGRQIHCAGALHVFLGRRDLPADRRLRRRFERLVGTVLVLCHDGEILVLVTAYRNRNALRELRRKGKYDRRSYRRSSAA
jgi:hypothetical protein